MENIVIQLDKMIDDIIDDDVNELLKKFRLIPTWTKEKRELHKQLVTLLMDHKYKELWLNISRFPITRIGRSFLYHVPINKRGHLIDYRGKIIRIISTGISRFYVQVMIKVIDPDTL